MPKGDFTPVDNFEDDGKGPRRRMDRVKKRPQVERDELRPRAARDSKRTRRREWDDILDDDLTHVEELDDDLEPDDTEDIDVRLPRKRQR